LNFNILYNNLTHGAFVNKKIYFRRKFFTLPRRAALSLFPSKGPFDGMLPYFRRHQPESARPCGEMTLRRQCDSVVGKGLDAAGSIACAI
jgi:hypothetical protein